MTDTITLPLPETAPAPAGDTPPNANTAATNVAPQASTPVNVAPLAGLNGDQIAAVQEMVNAGVDLAKASEVVRKIATAPTVQVQNTLPSQGAPREHGNPQSVPDPNAMFVEMMKTNPYAAARYAEHHGLIRGVGIGLGGR
jgi:hypothetical protein